ncbi:restriction endonuclease subunit S [Zobellia uliginosa]|uniref:restriction endonuclease subunit S n=1 Tax=Zobellia uliginosa TaxID=143224 RepID=UPI0026E2177A|nr:restriction endonuclease subunit S [Zobellia uliginosa]MDO6516571.1 restriction endonuclease subunit S [Zobellia uliginosa]
MSVKKVEIKSIVSYRGIFSGYSFRGKISPESGGELEVVQLKDIGDDYSGIGDNCVFVNGSAIKDKYHLKDRDILFCAKGANNYAVIFHSRKNHQSVASSAFFVLRLDQDKALPEYVAWYINQPMVQQYLESRATGTYTTSINRETVENIPIVLPSLQKQKKVANIANLMAKEQSLYRQLMENKKRLAQNQLLKAIQ